VTLAETIARWAAGLEAEAIPDRVRAVARSLVLSQLAAARATLDHDLGERLVRAFGPPLQADPKRSAYVLAALTIALDFDDTEFAGHTTHSAVNVPLAYARSGRLDGGATLAATIAAIECAARVTAAATLGPLRGQSATHCHLVGAAVARLHCERAPPERWPAALAIALTAPPWPLMRGFLASDAKVLAAATPLLAGLDACDAAAAGIGGAADIVEHPEGFLARFAEVPLPETVVSGLGERWHTETASPKVHPGSAYIGSAVDCAIELHAALGSVDPDEVVEIVVSASVFTAEIERRMAPYLEASRPATAALGFSLGHNVATALLTGSLGDADLAPDAVRDPRRRVLAAKVRIADDADLTRAALNATAPLGEALRQAGTAARPWLERHGGTAAGALAGQLGPPSSSFSSATKAVGARVTVHFRDGSEASVARAAATGSAGSCTRQEQFALMRKKFLGTGGSEEVVAAVARFEELDAAELRAVLSAALGR
jgi:2-methylcitrate dehydratase PrpD